MNLVKDRDKSLLDSVTDSGTHTNQNEVYYSRRIDLYIIIQ